MKLVLAGLKGRCHFETDAVAFVACAPVRNETNKEEKQQKINDCIEKDNNVRNNQCTEKFIGNILFYILFNISIPRVYSRLWVLGAWPEAGVSQWVKTMRRSPLQAVRRACSRCSLSLSSSGSSVCLRLWEAGGRPRVLALPVPGGGTGTDQSRSTSGGSREPWQQQ